MKVLITGGSGFLGINIIRFLLTRGINDLVSMDLLDFDYPEKNLVKTVKGDIRDKNAVAEVMKNADIIIHTAAALPMYKKNDIYTTDVEGTRNLLLEAEKQKVKRFIHISSTAVYGIPDHHPLYEDDKLTGVGDYGEAKILAEKVCEEFRERGMCIPIIRPKSFIGPERLGVFALFYDWANSARGFPMIGSGDNRYQLLDVEDLCESIYLCITKNFNIVNDTFNIGAAEFTTMKEDYQAVLDYAGHSKKITGVPAWPVILTLRILEFFRLSPLYKWVYETAGKDSFVSIDKAINRLGFSPKFSNKDALIRNYKWYLENLHNFDKLSGISHRVPWKQGILKFAKIFF